LIQARELELKELIQHLAPEDIVEGERYDGVIRFAMPVESSDGKLEGIISLALDHIHLMQCTQHIKAMEDNATVFAGSRESDFAYLFDDQGWVITHPQQWWIRGVDSLGQVIDPFSEKTTASEILVGRTPINLLHLDWKIGKGLQALVHKTRAGNIGIVTYNNSTYVYCPIFYEQVSYAKYGIFGGVMMGTRSDKFIDLLRGMNAHIVKQTSHIHRLLFGLFVFILGLIVGSVILIFRYVTITQKKSEL
jgi:hypothetical protein